jgi:tetratricopeptide (TPR) repeat protein/predicted aspartyl protease
MGLLFLPLLASAPAMPANCKLVKILELPVIMDGMQPLVNAKINSSAAKLLVDSGAFYSTISMATAAEFKLKTEPLPSWFYVIGVGGTVTPRYTTVKDFTIGPASLHAVEFIVGGGEVSSDAVGVVGQNVLGYADAEYDLANGFVRLMRAQDCGGAELAYWTREKQQPYSVIEIERADQRFKHTYGNVYVSGIKVRALFDTGAYTSVLSLQVAERLGIKPGAPGVLDGGIERGIGKGVARTWIAPFQSFKIGDEEIKNTRLRIGSTGNPDIDMLVGADFFLSHRIYVANSQRKLYLSYNGGPVFNLTVNPLSAASSASSSASSSAQLGDGGPQLDAPGYAARGAAAAARRDFEGAIADLSRAIELDAQNGDYVRIRAMAYWQKGDAQHSLADLDQAITLNPSDAEAMLDRAQLRLANHDAIGATSDLDAADGILPEQADQRFAMGQLYGRSEHFQAAVRQFTLWIGQHRQDSRLVWALNGRCWFSALGNLNLTAALQDCDRAVDLAAKDAAILNSRAFVRLRMGQLDKAMSDFDAAIKLEPRDAWSLYGRAIVEGRKGLAQQSQADLTAAAALQADIAERGRHYGFE